MHPLKFTVKANGCHEFDGAKNDKGYGNVRRDGIWWKAHRYSWVLHNGPITDGLWVLHKCDNPPCINPDHLFLGDRQANVDDMIAKGRAIKTFGEDHPHVKLTDNDVERIREAHLFGARQIDLAAVYGTYQGTIGRYVRNEVRVAA